MGTSAKQKTEQVSPDTAAAIEALKKDKERRVHAVESEIEEILNKHKCALRSSVTQIEGLPSRWQIHIIPL